MKALEARPRYVQENWLVVITSSYGGVYEGNVLLWNKRANQATDPTDTVGSIVNATTGKLMGNIKDLEGGITNVTADASGNVTLAGIGGLFGLHMTGSHAGVPLLTSGFSEKEKCPNARKRPQLYRVAERKLVNVDGRLR